MGLKSRGQLDEIAIKIVNLLANDEICIGDINYLFEKVRQIIELETKIKRIDS